MVYEIRFTDLALQGLAKLAKSEPKAYQKALRFIEELKEHPYMGTGHPEPLKGKPEGRWSREITKKHRMVGLSHLRYRGRGTCPLRLWPL